MILLPYLAVAAALASPVREAGRERPSQPNAKSDRFTEVEATFANYVRSHASPSARPDGSGAAQSRTELFLRDSTDGDLMQFIGDAIFLSDSSKWYKPASLDYYLGVRKQSPAGRFLAVGRDEAMPLDHKGFSSRYWDLRLGTAWFGGGAAGAYVGWFFKNDGMPARSDQSGDAYLRYAVFLHSTNGPVGFRFDADFLTDQHLRRYRPASVMMTVGATVNWKRWVLEASYKPWIPLDHGKTIDSWLLGFSFHFDGRDIYNSTPGEGI